MNLERVLSALPHRQRHPAAPADLLQVGTAEQAGVWLPPRCCLRTLGAVGTGRTLVLASLAEQTLAQGGAVLWADGRVHPQIGATLRESAARLGQNYVTTGLANDDAQVVRQLLTRGGVGHCVPGSAHEDPRQWRARIHQLLREIGHGNLAGCLGPVLFVFNEIAMRYPGEPLGLGGLAGRLRAAGHSMVFSDRELAQDATDVAAHARQFLFHRVETPGSLAYAAHVIGPWPAVPRFLGLSWGTPAYRRLDEDLSLLDAGRAIWHADGESRLIRATRPAGFAGPRRVLGEPGRH
ncbi:MULTISPECIES: hypothetical protein [Cupriavidus]